MIQLLRKFKISSDRSGFAQKSREFILSWLNIDAISEDYIFILEDQDTGEELVNLRDDDQITFSTGEFTGDYEYFNFTIVVSYIGTSVESDLLVIPEIFSLASVYPNPFNPSITATIELPEAANLDVRVYNILGKEVAVLANNRYEAGHHKINFNAQDLASGVYLLIANVPGKMKEVRKIMLVK
ncbi:MAG: T9SS type A sorting domain-containing protein [Candidatus Electryonea clarkiae]|nr:T9SS type A sorting domain-containing protein [Candidatus Electryonea clarkiae]MDP8288420.1 T9SS type A sorting domain-containing protein [Candidatus Electryonea clarkiae]